jgi:hypothetical protein
MKTMKRRTLAPTLLLVMALAVGACSPVDDNPGETPPAQLTTTTTLDS